MNDRWPDAKREAYMLPDRQTDCRPRVKAPILRGKYAKSCLPKNVMAKALGLDIPATMLALVAE